MKRKTIAALAFTIGLIIGGLAAARICRPAKTGAARIASSDTVRIVERDTIRIVQPQPAAAIAQARPKRARLPVIAEIPADTASPPQSAPLRADSALVEIPMETKTYTDSATYRAVVSGAWATLDTIELWPAREVVTIRQRQAPKRWSIGVGAGYGYTPRGMQPWAGVTLTYSILTF